LVLCDLRIIDKEKERPSNKAKKSQGFCGITRSMLEIQPPMRVTLTTFGELQLNGFANNAGAVQLQRRLGLQ
jgi:hypothetical protein